MKRLRHWLLNFATAVSAVMCLATMVLWLCGLFRAQELRYFRWDQSPAVLRQYSATTNAGFIQLIYVRSALNFDLAASPKRSGVAYGSVGQSQPSRYWWLLRSDVDNPSNPEITRTIAGAHASLFIVISGMLPTIWIVLRRIRTRLEIHSRGLCPVCGYDLRATPDRCPECGAIPSGAKGSAT